MFLVDLLIDIFSAFIIMLPVMILLPKFMKKQKVIVRKSHKIGMVLYVIVIAAIFSINGLPSLFHMKLDTHINYIPFKNIADNYLLYIESGVAFIFLGFLLPVFWKNSRSFKNTFFYGFCFSLLIEIIQLFCSRLSDINDLIFNTLGLCIGYLLFSLLRLIKNDIFENTYLIFRNRKRTSIFIRYEFILYTVLIFIFMFCLQSIISNLVWRLIYTVVLFQ